MRKGKWTVPGAGAALAAVFGGVAVWAIFATGAAALDVPGLDNMLSGKKRLEFVHELHRTGQGVRVRVHLPARRVLQGRRGQGEEGRRPVRQPGLRGQGRGPQEEPRDVPEGGPAHRRRPAVHRRRRFPGQQNRRSQEAVSGEGGGQGAVSRMASAAAARPPGAGLCAPLASRDRQPPAAPDSSPGDAIPARSWVGGRGSWRGVAAARWDGRG